MRRHFTNYPHQFRRLNPRFPGSLLVVLVLLGVTVSTSGAQVLRRTLRNTPIRERPAANGPVRQTIPRGELVFGFWNRCRSDGWCQGRRIRTGSTGWVRESDLETVQAAQIRSAREAEQRTVTLYDHLDVSGPKLRRSDWALWELPSAFDSKVSSLVVQRDVWVSFYDEPRFRGSALHVRGPLAIANLGAIPRIRENWFDGNWNDQIESYRVNSRRPGGVGTFCDEGGCHTYQRGVTERVGAGLTEGLGAIIKGAAWVIEHMSAPTPVEEPPPSKSSNAEPTVATYMNRMSMSLYVYTLSSSPEQPRHCDNLRFIGRIDPEGSLDIRVPTGQNTWVRIQRSTRGAGCYESENKLDATLWSNQGAITVVVDGN